MQVEYSANEESRIIKLASEEDNEAQKSKHFKLKSVHFSSLAAKSNGKSNACGAFELSFGEM